MRDLLESFRGVRPSGDGWVGKCPAHDDHRASLSIGRGDDGRWLLKCHAGCDIDAILQAGHLERRDLFLTNGKDSGRRQIVATHDYADEHGALLSQVVRFAPKDFRQRKPDGHGGWEWNRRGVRWVLYRLHELQGKEAVVICEGEKDANRLWDVGIPATTCPGGAGKWRQEYAGQLRDAGTKRVAITPDNDTPGRDHADKVAASCHAAGLEVRIVDLPNLPDKGDVSDYLDRHDADALRQLLKDAQRYVPDTTLPTPAETAGPRMVCLSDVEPEEVEWLWPDRIPRGKFSIIAGDPGLGKSFLTLDLAARVSTGRELPDGSPGVKGTVVLLSAEDGLADTIRPRLDALGADVSAVHCLEAVRDADGEHPFSLSRDLPALEQAIEMTGAMLVAIDPFSAYLGGGTDSYKDSEVRRVLAPLAKLAERLGVAIVGVIHLSKSADRKAIHRALGSVAFTAAARSSLGVAKDPEDEQRRFLVTIKCNLAPEAPALAYRLVDGRVEWEPDPVCGLSADELLGANGREDEGQDAKAFLREELSDGPVSGEDLIRAGRKNGIAEITLRRTKKRLEIESTKIGFGPEGKWMWSLPAKAITEADEAPKALTSGKVSALAPDPVKRADSIGVAPNPDNS